MTPKKTKTKTWENDAILAIEKLRKHSNHSKSY